VKSCPVNGCETPVDRSMLMCRRHWFSIPKDLRDDVWRTYGNGRGILDEAYGDAVDAAIEAAERKGAAA
jgi:hypothetical protein